MDSKRTEAHVADLYAILGEYEAELLVATNADPEHLRWLGRVINHLRATVIEIENNEDD